MHIYHPALIPKLPKAVVKQLIKDINSVFTYIDKELSAGEYVVKPTKTSFYGKVFIDYGYQNTISYLCAVRARALLVGIPNVLPITPPFERYKAQTWNVACDVFTRDDLMYDYYYLLHLKKLGKIPESEFRPIDRLINDNYVIGRRI